MPSIRGVIFDLGSTLIRFRGDWTDVLTRGRAEMVAWLQQAGPPLVPATPEATREQKPAEKQRPGRG